VISARVDMRLVDRLFVLMRKPDLRPAWKEAAPLLRGDIKAHRVAQAGPDGSWPARSPRTRVRASSKRRARPRKLLGKLPTALTTISARDRVAMRSRVAWSDVHQSGGTAGHGARIPKRPFLWASQRALKAISEVVAAYIAKISKRVA
jgi:phage gpG-like protein